MKTETTKPTGNVADEKLFDNWFDPVETSLRAKVRGFIETMIEEELNTALARPRYGRRLELTAADNAAAPSTSVARKTPGEGSETSAEPGVFGCQLQGRAIGGDTAFIRKALRIDMLVNPATQAELREASCQLRSQPATPGRFVRVGHDEKYRECDDKCRPNASIADPKQTLIDEIAAWEGDQNVNHAKADWQFTTADAGIKLKHLYPSI